MNRFLLTVAFVIGAIFGNLLMLQYWWRSRWRSTRTGHILLALFAVIAVSYDLTVLSLLWPHLFEGDTGSAIRIVVRFAIDAVLIGMYVLLVRAQRQDRDAPSDLDRTRPGGSRQSTE
jgi:hypothetical protein